MRPFGRMMRGERVRGYVERAVRVSKTFQELLGHASIQTTERYLGKNEGFKRAITDLITEPLPSV